MEAARFSEDRGLQIQSEARDFDVNLRHKLRTQTAYAQSKNKVGIDPKKVDGHD